MGNEQINQNEEKKRVGMGRRRKEQEEEGMREWEKGIEAREV